MPKEKVLVVDDDEMIRWTLGEALRGWSYQPIEAGSIAEGLQAFENEQPAAVLLDVGLPDGAGLGVLRGIKSSHGDAGVIMINANRLVVGNIDPLRGGPNDFN